MVEVEPGVIEKLVLFSIALVILPLGVLLASIHGFFDAAILGLFGTVTDNLRQLFGAVMAVVAVNAVVIAYVVSAYREKPPKDSKKSE